MEPRRVLELEKVGFNVPATVLLGGSAALGGVSIYDYLKSRGLVEAAERVTKDFEKDKVTAKPYVKKIVGGEKPKEGIDQPVDVIVTRKDLTEAFKKSKELKGRDFTTVANREYLGKLQKHVEKHKDNAFAWPGDNRYLILTPDKVNRRVLDHEIGHIKDWSERGREQPDILRRLLSKVWKPTYKDIVIGPEERAWRNAKVSSKLVMKEKALETYKKGFHSSRSKAALGGALLSGLLGALLLKE